MNDIDGLKALLFDMVIERLCDMMIEDCTSNELDEFLRQLVNKAEQNGYREQLVASACAAGLRKLSAEIEANKDPKRKSSPIQVMRMALRFTTFYYMLAQIRPKNLEENEKWAYDAADIPEKDRPEVGKHNMVIFLMMLSDREIKKVFKGEELKRVRQWRKHIKG